MAGRDACGMADSRYSHACSGKTDIACFNEWAEELRETGYLHNHARMWFASIWIFTLNLPWQWGAAFLCMAARWRSGLQYIELALGCRLA